MFPTVSRPSFSMSRYRDRLPARSIDLSGDGVDIGGPPTLDFRVYFECLSAYLFSTNTCPPRAALRAANPLFGVFGGEGILDLLWIQSTVVQEISKKILFSNYFYFYLCKSLKKNYHFFHQDLGFTKSDFIYLVVIFKAIISGSALCTRFYWWRSIDHFDFPRAVVCL